MAIAFNFLREASNVHGREQFVRLIFVDAAQIFLSRIYHPEMSPSSRQGMGHCPVATILVARQINGTIVKGPNFIKKIVDRPPRSCWWGFRLSKTTFDLPSVPFQ